MSRYANANAGAVERDGAGRGVRGMAKSTRSAHLRASLRAEEAGGRWLCAARTAMPALPGPGPRRNRAGPQRKRASIFGEGAPRVPFLEQEPPLLHILFWNKSPRCQVTEVRIWQCGWFCCGSQPATDPASGGGDGAGDCDSYSNEAVGNRMPHIAKG